MSFARVPLCSFGPVYLLREQIWDAERKMRSEYRNSIQEPPGVIHPDVRRAVTLLTAAIQAWNRAITEHDLKADDD